MRRTRLLSAIAATVPAASVYMNTLDFEFVYDDKTQIAQNPYVQDPRYLASLFTTSVWEFQSTAVTRKESNYYRPIFMLSLALTDRAAGLDPRGFHALSIAVTAPKPAISRHFVKARTNPRPCSTWPTCR